jgi:hypothetical protein
MSRGMGKIQRCLFGILARHNRPMTFEEIMHPPPKHGCGHHPQFVRSVRRSLRKMIDDNTVVTIGKGGPRDPFRYCHNPRLIAAFAGEAYDELMDAIQADGGHMAIGGTLYAVGSRGGELREQRS